MTQYRADVSELASSYRKWYSVYEEGVLQMALVEVLRSAKENVVKFKFGTKTGEMPIKDAFDKTELVEYLRLEFCRANAEFIASQIIKMIEL